MQQLRLQLSTVLEQQRAILEHVSVITRDRDQVAPRARQGFETFEEARHFPVDSRDPGAVRREEKVEPVLRESLAVCAPSLHP